MFNPYSVDDIATKLSTAWLDDRLRRDLAERGKERAKDFSWDQAASSFQLLYRYIARRTLSDEERMELQRMFD